MGHLLLDGVFDEEKYERGVIKLLRAPAEEDQLEVFTPHSIHKRHHHALDRYGHHELSEKSDENKSF